MVVIKGENENEIVKMLEYGVDRGVEIRYLELMGMGPLYKKDDFKLIDMHEILRRISKKTILFNLFLQILIRLHFDTGFQEDSLESFQIIVHRFVPPVPACG